MNKFVKNKGEKKKEKCIKKPIKMNFLNYMVTQA